MKRTSSREFKVHQFDPIIYPFKFWIAITNDMNALSELFVDHKSGKKLNTDPPDKMIAFTQNVEQKSDYSIGAVIVFTRIGYCTVKNIAHEATHAAQMLWDHIGEDAPGIEAEAYLIGWLSECCEKVRLNKL